MEPNTTWDVAFQEWHCERGPAGEAAGEHGECVNPRGAILPGTGSCWSRCRTAG